MVATSAKKKKVNYKEDSSDDDEYDESDSEDDVPLAALKGKKNNINICLINRLLNLFSYISFTVLVI